MTSSANTAVSTSRPRKMHGASALTSESAISVRTRPSSIGGSAFSAPRRNGSRRRIGSISEDGSRRLDSIQFESVRFSLARLRGLPEKGIIQPLREKRSEKRRGANRRALYFLTLPSESL